MQPKKETKVKIIAVSCAMIFLLFIGVIGFNQHVNHELNQKNIVKIKTNDDSTVLFYRDDCKSCRSIFSYAVMKKDLFLSLIHISEPTRLHKVSRMPSSA